MEIMMIPANLAVLAPLIPDDADEYLQDMSVTYQFDGAGISVDTREFLGRNSDTIVWTAAQMEIVRDTFAYIETVVNLTFEEVSDGRVDIGFQQVPFLDDLTVGFADQVGPGRSIVVLPTEYIQPVVDGKDNTTVIHEIGHAIGLNHPFEGPDALPGVSNPFDEGDFSLNTELATRMAYVPGVSANFPNVDIRGEAASFGALDIAALQVMYGANETTGLGNTAYGVDADLITIWDNGGVDVIDFSAATDNAVIDLRAATLAPEVGGGGFLSFIGSDGGRVANGGYTIAFGVEVENGFGGGGDDLLTGNAQANTLTGGGGDDRIIGGDGLDTATYSGNQSHYTLTLGGDEITLADRHGGGDGVDQLESIEALTFGDAAVAPFDLAKIGGTQDLTQAEMESFIELYIAYFERAPDAIGLNFWGTAFATGTTFEEMAALFADQDETRAIYAGDMNSGAFTTAVYDNVLGRFADAEGFDFWVDVLDSGARTRDQFILSVLEGVKAPIAGGSDELRAQQVADQQYLNAKTDIGAYYAVTKGLSNLADAAEVMAVFDGSAASIGAAQTAIDGYYDAALDADNGGFILQLVGVVDDPFASAMM